MGRRLTTLSSDANRYVVLSDDELVPNSVSTPISVEFETLPDSTAPKFQPGYPLLVAVDDSSAGVQVRLNELGRFAFVVTEAGAPTPSALEVFAGTDGAGSPGVVSGAVEVGAALVTAVAALRGLASSTSYNVYVAETALNAGVRTDTQLLLFLPRCDQTHGGPRRSQSAEHAGRGCHTVIHDPS